MKSLPIRHHRSNFLRFALLAVAVAGCNSILDNKPGTLKQMTDVSPATPSATTTTPSASLPQMPPTTSDDAGASTPPPAPPSPTGECADGMFLCNGQCVGKNDPAYGCGAASCTPCLITHGTAQCVAGACAVKTCDKGYSDCNGKAADGCELDLSKATSCGACNAVCPAAAPVCAPAGDSFECGTGCTPAAPLLCGAECVDPMTSKNHCGSCGMACPDVPNGETTCTAGLCGFTCHPDFHACNGKCAAASDVNACGASCAVCPKPPNATPSCTGGACGFVCSAGFADCNQNAADGCEVTLATDLQNCGACGVKCEAGGTCTDGKCTAPPPPPADDGGAPPP